MKTIKQAKTSCPQGGDTVSTWCGHTKTKTNTNTRDQELALEKNQHNAIRFVEGNCVIDGNLVKSAFGSENPDFIKAFAEQFMNAATKGQKVDEGQTLFFASMITGVEPRDQIEAMLAAQMAAVHNATMVFARRLAHVENIPQQDAAERAFNKLARTFTTQLDALKRYRSSGQQVVVKHVTVNDGGQAVVGNVTTAGGVKK